MRFMQRPDHWAVTWSKMATGMARVAQALGTSTIPDRRPSHGQQDSNR